VITIIRAALDRVRRQKSNRTRTTVDRLIFPRITIAEWFNAEGSFHRLGRIKLGQLMTFEESILNYFSNHFHDLRPCVRELYAVICPYRNPRQSKVTYDEMISIFEKALEKLPITEILPESLRNVPANMAVSLGERVAVGRKRVAADADMVSSEASSSKRSRR
jgi:hypothetical protein